MEAAEAPDARNSELGGKSRHRYGHAPLLLACERIARESLNAGQTCVAPDYVLVHAPSVMPSSPRCGKSFRNISVTFPPPGGHDLIAQQRHWERIMELIDPAKVVIGGTGMHNPPHCPDGAGRGFWSDEVMQEEIFGPVLPVLTYSDLKPK